MNRCTGKTLLITGGTSGMGLATAHRLVAEGAYVIVTVHGHTPKWRTRGGSSTTCSPR